MRVGLDAFTVSCLGLSPRQQLDYAKANNLAGVQGYFGDLADPDVLSELKDLRAYADSLGLYTETTCQTPNPHAAGCSREDLLEQIAAQVQGAAACGWHELHSWAGGPDARARTDIAWKTQLDDTISVFRAAAPMLRDHGSRINLEPKAGISTFEAVRIIESAGADIAGVCLDTANTLVFAEDPVAAACRVAPYTHMTHAKDAIVYFSDEGIRRQGREPGAGVVDWDAILPILAEHEPDLNLSIEDHKWLWDAEIFTPGWISQTVPEITAEELAVVVSLAWRTTQRIAAGDVPDPAEYEDIPFEQQMEDRLLAGRDHLRDCLTRLRLES